MQANDPPAVQFGASGEQWWQIPIGAAIYASDNVPVGTVAAIGTSYLRAGESMMAEGDLHIPLQMIGMFDAQTNIVHLNAPSETVRAIAGAVPANDPHSLQSAHYGTLPMPATQGVTTVRETTISLREQEVVIVTLPHVVKEVTVRREARTGVVTMTETVRSETAHVETEDGDPGSGQ
jgi:hypothetical protein